MAYVPIGIYLGLCPLRSTCLCVSTCASSRRSLDLSSRTACCCLVKWSLCVGGLSLCVHLSPMVIVCQLLLFDHFTSASTRCHDGAIAPSFTENHMDGALSESGGPVVKSRRAGELARTGKETNFSFSTSTNTFNGTPNVEIRHFCSLFTAEHKSFSNRSFREKKKGPRTFRDDLTLTCLHGISQSDGFSLMCGISHSAHEA